MTVSTPTASNLPRALEEQPREDMGQINVSENERIFSALGGGALVLYGLSQRSLLGTALALTGGALVHRGITGHCYAYGALGINTATPTGGIRVERAVTVGLEPAELYQFWRNFENLPRIMDHLESVTTLDGQRSHWVAKAPLGMQVEWDAEIIEEEENRLIAWRSLPGADVENTGLVRFTPAPGNRGTEIHVTLTYNPPAGVVGAAVARLLGEEPQQQIGEDLRRFKQLMEAGEIATVDGQPAGAGRGRENMPEDTPRKPIQKPPADLVTETSMESFPASDPPAWNVADEESSANERTV